MDSKVVDTDVVNVAGYPVDKFGHQICVYRNHEVYINGNRKNGRPAILADYPELQRLVDELNN